MLKISKKGECIRAIGNYSKQDATDKIDKGKFNLQHFKENIQIKSPKLQELLNTINGLDKADMKNHKKLFKHIIYTDIKSSAAGAKMLAAGLMSNGFTNVYDKSLKVNKQLLQHNAYNNFALLCSVQIYDKPFPVSLKKEILTTFNQRPDNIYGEQIRFIILDQGYKEGIDVFDVKYVHLFEPLISDADMKQAIGRGTRYCGQKGLEFNPMTGWPLHVMKYDLLLDNDLQKQYNANTINELFIANSGLNLSKMIFASELETISRYGAVDYELTQSIHEYTKNGDNIISPGVNEYIESRSTMLGRGIKGKKKRGLNRFITKAPRTSKQLAAMRKYIQERFMKYKWDKIDFENKCIETEQPKETSRIVQYTPSQDFVSRYFNNTSAHKGLLLWHSVGTGKTCSAIAVASRGFEPHGYTILWVTRHTLKSDIWKNMYENVCSASITKKLKNGEDIPTKIKTNPLRYLPNWVLPISYKQFSNMLAEKNDIYRIMKQRNGANDPLRKTLVIIDEVHKLYSSDLPPAERPNLKIMKQKIRHSYKVSGKDSVRLLLMTATPYTSDPMDLIKILNLMREHDMPESFEEFHEQYLDENSKFTEEGADKYLDNISGYISYLNRERDARQFAYPVFYDVKAFISKRQNGDEDKILEQMHKAKQDLETLESIPLKPKTKEEKLVIKTEIKNLKTNIKEMKKEISSLKKISKEDISQETALAFCLKK